MCGCMIGLYLTPVADTIHIQRESFSLGCTGMRTFIEIDPVLLSFLIPGPELAKLAESLSQVYNRNKEMLDSCQMKKSDFA
jgi:uncharacterized protein (DUF169 family)